MPSLSARVPPWHSFLLRPLEKCNTSKFPLTPQKPAHMTSSVSSFSLIQPSPSSPQHWSLLILHLQPQRASSQVPNPPSPEQAAGHPTNIPPNHSSETYLGACACFNPFFPTQAQHASEEALPTRIGKKPMGQLGHQVNLKAHRHAQRSLSASSCPLLWLSSTPLCHPQNPSVFSLFAYALSPQQPSDPTGIRTYRNNSHKWAPRKEQEHLSLTSIGHLVTSIDASLPSTHRLPVEPIYLTPTPHARHTGWTQR